eukprot:CAMPEP_0197271400 /NCGR_PEP_ID=MMETSP1432-20130617/8495_1 /TAXON_ID=44447 /ORGANISM="Pseudo-nitzschia delicatissima, Strain UNC1205" /LENGTH=326 /DNA_ID=CAMNT_0042736817 /DNA_START=24 /DNA_END=1000 /DNA_ORIENTATION=-
MDVVLNQEESLDTGMAETMGVSFDQNNTDPLGPPSSNDNDSSIPRTTFAGDDELEESAEFTAARNNPRLRSFLRYTRSILALASAVLLDLTRSDNNSLVSKIMRIVATGFVYATIYTTLTGMMLWAIAYLMDHGWYLLAATSSVVLLLVSCILLVVYEWMWSWQGSVVSYLGSNSGYHRLRSVTVLNDDEMEDDLTLRGWIRQIVRALVSCLVWSLYCVLNVKIDFWITDLYVEARPNYFKIELRLVNCFEAAPILLGAALLLYVAYPSFYQLTAWMERLSAYARGADNSATQTFASTEELDSERYTIQVDEEDNEVTMGVGMQNL